MKNLLTKILADADLAEAAPRKSPEQKQALKEFAKPDLEEAKLYIGEDRSYGAEGWDLKVSLPVSVDFLKAKENEFKMNEFSSYNSSDPVEILVMMLSKWLPSRLGPGIRLGQPHISTIDLGRQRAKGGMKEVSIGFGIKDPIAAYALGLDLTQFGGGAQVLPKEEIAKRMVHAKEVAQEAAELRKAIKDGQKTNEDWKDFMAELDKTGMNYKIAKSIPVAASAEEAIENNDLKDHAMIKKIMKQSEAAEDAAPEADSGLLDAICNELKRNNFDCMHQEIEDEGSCILVKRSGQDLAKLVVQDVYPVDEMGPQVESHYVSASLFDADGVEISANYKDYFMMQPEEIFPGALLILTAADGEEKEIEEPTKEDLPDREDAPKPEEAPEEEAPPADSDEVVVLFDEAAEMEFPVHVSADHQTVELGELSAYLNSKALPPVESAVTAAKKEKKVEAEDQEATPSAAPQDTKHLTYKQRMDLIKAIYPDAEKILNKIGKMSDEEGIAQVNRRMSDDDSNDSQKVEGLDLELPYWLKESMEGAEPKQEGQAIHAMEELAAIFPSFKKWMDSPDHMYLSYGESHGMMPYHHAKYPSDAILHTIEGQDTEEEVQYDVSDLAKIVGKAGDLEKFKQFLKEVSDQGLGHVYRYDGASNQVECYPRVQYVMAMYYKLAEALKALNKARKLDKKVEADEQKVNELIKAMKDGAGDYE